jgi:hypothetical protein
LVRSGEECRLVEVTSGTTHAVVSILASSAVVLIYINHGVFREYQIVEVLADGREIVRSSTTIR